MRKMLILGAGIYQVPLIRKARQMGLYVIAASRPGHYPGFAEADECWYIDTTDGPTILDRASRCGIDGICTTGTDVAVRTIGLVCDSLKLPGISRHAAEILTDKALMKEAFRGKVSTTEFRVVKSEEEAREAADSLGFPLMVKACDVSGSRGILRVNRPEELEGALRDARAASLCDHLVMEKVAPGSEIGLDGYIRNGRAAACFPHRKYVCHAGAVTIPAGHGFPFRGSPALMRKLEDELERIAEASGLREGAVNCDIMVDGETVNVIEAGGRCGATGIPELIGMHTGIDYYAQILKGALGEETDFSVRRSAPCIGKLLMSPADGRVERIDRERLTELSKRTGARIWLDIKPGDTVRRMRNGTDRIGQVFLLTSSEEEAELAVSGALSCIHIKPMV